MLTGKNLPGGRSWFYTLLLLFSFTVNTSYSTLRAQSKTELQTVTITINNGRSAGPCEYIYDPGNVKDNSNQQFYYCFENPLYGTKPMDPIPLGNIREINTIVQVKNTQGTPIRYFSAELILMDDSKMTVYIWSGDKFTLKCKKMPVPESFTIDNIRSLRFEYPKKK